FKEKLSVVYCAYWFVGSVLGFTYLDCSTHDFNIITIDILNDENIIFVGFKTFEEIWKFSTYWATGHCMENLLFDEKFWLSSLEENFAIEVSIQEETLNLIYKGILMQEGSLFASCSADQIFDSCTSGRDLYLEQGDIAHFEPPFLGSGWTVLSLSDGARGTAPTPALEPVIPFHQGSCLATVEYDAESPEELSIAPGDRIIIVGLLVSCFDWFTGRKEVTGEVGLVKTSGGLQHFSFPFIFSFAVSSSCKIDTPQTDLKKNMQGFLDQGKDSSDLIVTMKGTLEDLFMPTEAKDPSPPCFTVYPTVEGNINNENFVPLFSFLDGQECKAEFGVLYGLSSELLTSTTFSGHSDEEELIAFLGLAREAAMKKQLVWPQTRLCFLLGKLCAAKSNFIQARIYFEKALSVLQESFSDFKLLASIYSNLAAIYLLEKNTESFFAVMERLAALLLGIPDCLESLEDNSVLKYILKKAVLSRNKTAEARACYLLAKHYWTDRAERAQAVPYIERLLVLSAEAQRPWKISLSHGYLTLAWLYSELCLYHLSVSSARRASLQPCARLSNCLISMVLVLDNGNKLCGITEQKASIAPQVAPFLHLSFTKVQEGGRTQCHVLRHQLALCLCQLFYKHKMVEHAIHQMHMLINNSPPLKEVPIYLPERNSALIWLAWLHIENNQPDVALDILDSVLSTMPEHCTTPQEGVVLNMRGVVLRYMGDLQRAAESYQAAVDICEEYEDLSNWAVAQANLGLLWLNVGAKGLAQRHLTEAVQLFSELDKGHEANFIIVLLELGQHYLKQQQIYYGKGCYEWALLLAINANLLDCQLTATRNLCNLYRFETPHQAQCIIYSEHQVQLLRRKGDREQEGDALEAINHLYIILGTDRSLDYTKSSLGIFIDLGCREKEAFAWLQAGKIYHLLGQTELVDLYVEDRALPIAVTCNSIHTRLRLCNKLTEVMFSLKLYGAAVEFAQTALDISISQGVHLNERVAYHRLASLYHCLKQYELAEHYYLKTLTQCPTPLQFDEETLYYVKVYRALGDILFYDLKDPFDAAGYYHLALAAAMDLGNKRSQLELCTRLATIYHNFLIDRELSLFFYQTARGLAAELNVRRIDISPDKHYSSISQYKTTGKDHKIN
uniref:SH3 domain-containing protein n=1 Tax=Scophthalmus maximus TaxID=52904 RepID=A0A8D3E2X6_SCOMX